MTRERFNNLIRLSETQRDSVLNRLDRSSTREGPTPDQKTDDRREDPRLEFRQSEVPLVVEHLGGGGAWLLVCARNLSSGGIAFIHGGFLHPGSKCKLLLRKMNGEREVIEGEIVNCRHVEGSVHEVSVKFDRSITPSEYLYEAEPSESEGGSESVPGPTDAGS